MAESQVQVVLYVPLPIRKVWDIVSDFFGERHGWPTQVNITPLTQNGLTVGARKRVVDKADPQQAWVIERLLAVNAQEYWYTYTVDEGMEPGITGSDGLLQLFPEYNLAAGEQGRTRVVWSYALLPLEGEESVPRARMEQVRQTLVAYLMGLQHFIGVAAAEDSSSSDSESDGDDDQEERPNDLPLQPAIVVHVVATKVEETANPEENGSTQTLQGNSSIGEKQEEAMQLEGTQADMQEGGGEEDERATETPRDGKIQEAVAPDGTQVPTDLSQALQEETDRRSHQQGDPITQEEKKTEEIAEQDVKQETAEAMEE